MLSEFFIVPQSLVGESTRTRKMVTIKQAKPMRVQRRHGRSCSSVPAAISDVVWQSDSVVKGELGGMVVI